MATSLVKTAAMASARRSVRMLKAAAHPINKLRPVALPASIAAMLSASAKDDVRRKAEEAEAAAVPQ